MKERVWKCPDCGGNLETCPWSPEQIKKAEEWIEEYHKINEKPKEATKVWPEANAVIQEIYDDPVFVKINCKTQEERERTADAIRAVLQALNEGKAIFTIKINPSVFRKVCEAVSLEELLECIASPDGSKP